MIDDKKDKIQEEENLLIDINSDSNILFIEFEKLHTDILSKSIQSVLNYFICGIVYTFWHTNRVSIYILYANEFSPTTVELSLILYGYNFWNGIASLLYGSLSNEYGYDTVIICVTILQIIGVGLEAMAISFWMLFIGIMIAQVAITHIVIGYIAWILPLKYSTKYISYFYTSFVAVYLLGPILAGITSYFISYRMVFIMNSLIICSSLVYCLIKIKNTQNVLQQQQKLLNHNKYQEIINQKLQTDDEFELFPINLPKNTISNNENIKWYQIPNDISILHWIIMISITYINSTVSLAEMAVTLFYGLYIIQDLHSNIIYGTLGIALSAVGFIIGNLIIPIIFNKYNIKNVNIILWIINLLLIISAIILGLIYPYFQSVFLYSLWTLILGIFLGSVSMASETIILIIQPTKYSGKISGIKGLFRNWCQAFGALIITYWFDYQHLSFFYVSCVAMLIAIILVFVILCINKIKPNVWDPNYD